MFTPPLIILSPRENAPYVFLYAPCPAQNPPVMFGHVAVRTFPNITGYMKVGTWGGGIGAFYATKEIFQAAHVDEDVPLVKFDASRVSQIYSEVSTVQPRAIQTLIIIKV